jgi:hypothetical protein
MNPQQRQANEGFRIMVKGPNGEAKALSKEQFDVVHSYIVCQMNCHRPIKDGVIVKMLNEAGKPLIFTAPPEREEPKP